MNRIHDVVKKKEEIIMKNIIKIIAGIILAFGIAWIIPGEYPTKICHATVEAGSTVWQEAAKQASNHDNMSVVMESVDRLNPGLDCGRRHVQPGTSFTFEVKDTSKPLMDNAFKAFIKSLL